MLDVDDDAAAFGGDHPHRAVEVFAAVAQERAERIAGQAARVHAHQRIGSVIDIAEDQRDIGIAVDEAAVCVSGEFAEAGRHRRFSLERDEFLGAAAVGDEVVDGRDLEVVLPRKVE